MRGRSGAAQGIEGDAVPRHVEIKMVAPNESWPALQAVLTELLARLQVTVHFTSVPTVDATQIMNERSNDAPSAARVWIDMRDTSRVTLYLTGDRGDRLLIRHVPLVSRIDEVAREEIAHIVEATVDALLVGGRIGVVTDQPSRGTKLESSEPRERPSPVALNLGLAYEAHFWSSQSAPVHNAAMLIELESRTGLFRPAFWISAEYRFPTTIEHEHDPVSARLDQGAFRAAMAVNWAVSKKWLLGGGLGGGIDVVRITPVVSQGEPVAPAERRFTVVPMLRAMLLARVALGSRSEFFAGVAGDYDLFHTRYLYRDAQGVDVSVFEPWRLRPTALLGIATDVLAH